MRCIAAALLVVLVACGGDDSPPADAEREFLDGWSEIPEGPAFKGHDTRVDDEERVLYIGDCAAAKEATTSGGPYGPKSGQPGYAYVCP